MVECLRSCVLADCMKNEGLGYFCPRDFAVSPLISRITNKNLSEDKDYGAF